MDDLICPTCEGDLERAPGGFYCLECEQHWTLQQVWATELERDIETGKCIMFREEKCQD